MLFRSACAVAAAAACAFAQTPPYSGTIFNFPDAFLDTDPTTLTGVTYAGQQRKTVYDRRAGYIAIDAYVFTATFSDGAAPWSIMVNPEFDRAEAKALAEKYSRSIGQMPHCIRAGLTGAVIHDGNNPWGGGDPLTIHHGQGLSYERQGIVTETMIHESTHAGFDRKYYTADWDAAAKADGNYISTYARDNPAREDHSETFLCWLVARHKKDRVSAADFGKITATVPNRIAWYDAKDFNLSPVPGATGAARGTGRTGAPFALHAGGFDPALSGIAIRYRVGRPSRISLQILDSRGRIVRTLAREKTDPGSYLAVWDARSDAGREVPGGTYIYRLTAGGFQAARSLTLPR